MTHPPIVRPAESNLAIAPILHSLVTSRAAGACWFVLAIGTAFLAWQLLVGWPAQRDVPVRLRMAEAAEPGLVSGTMKTPVTPLDWNSPFTRVWVNGRELPRFQSRKALLDSRGDGCFVRGRGVLLRLSDRPAEWHVRARITRQPSWFVCTVWVVAFTGCSILLRQAGHPWLASVRALVRRIPFAPLLLVAVLSTALLLRLLGFSFPAWHSDSNEFMHPAADLAAGRAMSVTDRPLGYSVVVGLALRVWQDLRVVLMLHQLSSLVFAVALGCGLLACARRLFPPGASRSVANTCAVIATALWGCNERILHREWHLIPEALVPGYIGLQLWLLWRLTTRGLPRGRLLVEYALFCALGWVIYYTKPNWGFALAFLVVPWLALALMRASPARSFWRWALPGLGVFVLVCVGGLACQLFTPANTAAMLAIRYRVLICWHMDMVQAEIPRRLAAQPAPGERVLLEELSAVLDEERHLAAVQGPGTYHSLGYDADRLYYFGYAKAVHFWHLPLAERTRFCRELFFDALRHDPATYIRYVGRQVDLLWARPYGSAGFHPGQFEEELAKSEAFVKRPDPFLSPLILERYRAILAPARETLAGPWLSAPRAALALRVAPAIDALNAAFALCLALPLLLCAAAALTPAWRIRVAWRQIAPVLCLAIWALGSALGSALASSAAQALEIQRYVDLFMPVSLLAQILWPLLAWHLLHSAPWGRNHPFLAARRSNDDRKVVNIPAGEVEG